MEEVFPVTAGVVLGLVIAYLVPGRLRGWVLGVFGVLVGFTASLISGELAVSWLYVLVDVAQVLVAGTMTWLLVARWPRLGWAVLRRRV